MSKFATLLVAGLFIAGNAIAQAPATPATPATPSTKTTATAATPMNTAAPATPAKPAPVADSAKKDAAVKGEHKGDTKGAMEKKAAPETTKK